MNPLPAELRNKLERTIVEARDLAEAGAKAALEALAVHHHEPYGHMSPEERKLRNHLRARARQLGDKQNRKGELEITHLVWECAYEHWHRMLFARFLAENDLLIEPEMGVAISLEECEELAKEEGKDLWSLASEFAQRMLPQIFRPNDPVLRVTFASEHRLKLEKLLNDLEPAIFTANDSLGWVYQFWQSKRKKEVNESGNKIGADELPAVTQLFTESYMVSFLLDNSLGAWWAARRLTEADLQNTENENELRKKASLPGMPLEYLRFVKVAEASSLCKKEIGYFHKDEPIANISGDLPHWRQEGVTYFVTFRTVDSLPQEKLKQWQLEKERWLHEHPEPYDGKAKREFYEKFPERLQHWLDQGYGECVLKDQDCKKIVEEALRHFDGQRYDLDEFVVMPNHIHVLVTPKAGHELSEILHSWKSFTATEINKRMGRSGAFWQKESFDHIVRNPDQVEKIRQYIKEHPAYARDNQSQDGSATIWTPAAGTFDGWPERLSELKTLDPCCGSGHFLVAAFLMLVPMRMELEGLSAREAVDAVLRENLHGLEIDSRCVELAAFALALTAWRFPDAGGYRPLPELNVACSGLSISAKKEEWLSLACDNTNLRFALEELYKQFKDAPVLGSLINPEANLGKESLFELKWKEVGPLLTKALSGEKDDERTEIGVVALGITRAAEILAGKFDWIITNIPYLGRSKQNDTIKTFVDQNFPYALQDIGAVFLARLANFLSNNGIFCVVSPQNWSFLKTYLGLRKKIFKKLLPIFIAELGAGAFETPLYDFSFLLTIAKASPPDKLASYTSIVTSDFKGPQEKAKFLRSRDIGVLPFKQVFEMKDMRLLSKNVDTSNPLSKFCDVFCGIQTGDNDRFVRKYWETSRKLKHWEYYQRTTDISLPYGGMEQVLFWENGKGEMSKLPGFRDRLSENLVNALNAREIGFVVHRMGKLPCTIAGAKLFDQNGAVLVPKDRNFASQIWRFITSPEYNKFVRSYDNKVGVTPATLVRPSFSPHEPDQCEESLPKPYSDDPTQWIFHGYPCGSVVWDEHTKSTTHGPLRTDDTVLQVAVARLLGYCWPAELDSAMELCDETRTLVKKSEALLSLADEDGIVCISSMRGEEPAADRLREILSVAFGQDWSPAREQELIKATCANTAAFDDWLRDHFFEQHCKLFHHRPFIWHIWDGRRRDGFHALVNYHKLAAGNGKDRQVLENLTYSYLGDWISRQKEGVKRGEGGAEDRLAAALELQKRLIAIIEGGPPFDIFVRWKPIEEQPIGWEPDINDGVRLNIRPLMAQDIPGGRKGAGVLRWKPNIKWNKDRGKEPFRPKEQYPWFWKDSEFTGDRVNDIHLSITDKQKARKEKK